MEAEIYCDAMRLSGDQAEVREISSRPSTGLGQASSEAAQWPHSLLARFDSPTLYLHKKMDNPQGVIHFSWWR